MKTIAIKFKQLRLERSAREGRLISVQEVADALGVDRRVLYRYEHNTWRELDRDLFTRMCAFFGVTPCELVEFQEVATAEEAAAESLEGLVIAA